jgi:hypothetical protein
MQERNHCSTAKNATGCQSGQAIETVQRFPTEGTPLYKNANLERSELPPEIWELQDKAYSYVVRSVRLNTQTAPPFFEQTGSGPNFQGGVLTLCTCKHQMRTSQKAGDWPGTWLAGFTSRSIYDGRHWLFYLAKIKSAYESHSDLWTATGAASRKDKAAHGNFLGDHFEPKTPLPATNARFSPLHYVSPTRHAHRWRDEEGWHNVWHNDINYRHAEKYGHPPLLVADPQQTFIWNEPKLYFRHDHCRNFRKWPSLRKLLSELRPAR